MREQLDYLLRDANTRLMLMNKAKQDGNIEQAKIQAKLGLEVTKKLIEMQDAYKADSTLTMFLNVA